MSDIQNPLAGYGIVFVARDGSKHSWPLDEHIGVQRSILSALLPQSRPEQTTAKLSRRPRRSIFSPKPEVRDEVAQWLERVAVAIETNDSGMDIRIGKAVKEREQAAEIAGFDEGWNAAISDTMTLEERRKIQANGRGALAKREQRARLDEAERGMEHEDIYEGSCGVHMPRFCRKCKRLAALESEQPKP